MYSSLDKIDLVVDSPLRYVQTDHRSAEELAANPDLATLFALTRILKPQQHARSTGVDAQVVYATTDAGLPAFLEDVLAATGAGHQVRGAAAVKTYAQGDETPGELADRAFRGLAQRVSRRVGLTDMATVLRALEAETVADPPRQADDEEAYWARVLELAAVTCEIVRARSGGHWEIHHHADLPFGFATSPQGMATPAGAPGAGGIILATNRAHRFIADGKDESMFLLLAADREVSAAAMHTEDLPVMPNLRSRQEAVACSLAWRPLFTGAPDDPGFPVIAYGHDTPETFGAFLAERAGDLDVAHGKAMANLREQEVTTEEVDLEGVSMLAVSGSYYAAEKLLDRDFMRGLHRRLGHEILAASVPRRGLMFVTAVERSDKRELLVLQAATRHEAKTTRAISEAILLVKDGAVAGHVEISARRDGDYDDAEAGDGDDGGEGERESSSVEAPKSASAAPAAAAGAKAADEPPRKLGWFARLFGRKK
ncbi:MAG TPA: hypothetical protein VHE35_31960 [Kofleriaceae bacterium]|nr:hypothetical protein [Kofleriaceae bacterium]